MRGLVVVLGIAGALLVSGCLGGTGSGGAAGSAKRIGSEAGAVKVPIQENWAELVFTTGEGHDHRDMSHHQLLGTPNFEVLGWNELKTDYHGKPSGGYFCSDTIARDGRTLSVVHSWTTDVAFIISDVTDPTNPQKIGEFVMANTHVYDLAMSPDQKWVFLATSTSGAGNDPASGGLPPLYRPGDIVFRDACTGEETPVMGPEQGLPFAAGVVLINIANPRVPAIADFRFFPPGGGHSVQVAEIDGETLVVVTQSFPPVYYAFVRLLTTPAGTVMEVVSTYSYAVHGMVDDPPAPGSPPGVYSAHDATIRKHPITGDTLAYLAHGSASLVILNLNDPRSPEFVSRWSDWRGAFGEGGPANPFVHEALPMEEVWDGKHYTFIGEECGSRRQATPTCLVAVLDTTDPANPAFVGGWTLPVNIEWSGGLMYSLHYIGVQNRTFFAANYHGGLWAVDVSTPEALRTMPSIGVFMPDKITSAPVAVAHTYNYAPVILDVNPTPDGHLVVYDGTTGLYTVRFDASNPAPPPDPWPFPFNE